MENFHQTFPSGASILKSPPGHWLHQLDAHHRNRQHQRRPFSEASQNRPKPKKQEYSMSGCLRMSKVCTLLSSSFPPSHQKQWWLQSWRRRVEKSTLKTPAPFRSHQRPQKNNHGRRKNFFARLSRNWVRIRKANKTIHRRPHPSRSWPWCLLRFSWIPFRLREDRILTALWKWWKRSSKST